MILLSHPQGSDAWLHARCGVITASRFSDARGQVGGLSEQQAKYVNAILSGLSESTALALANYKYRPTAKIIDLALDGALVLEPSEKAMAYAWLIAMETIARKPLDDTFVTYAMRRGQQLEPQARRAYEQRTGALVEEVSLILTDDERFGYSSDGLVEAEGAVEIKCPFACEKIGNVWLHPEHAHLEYIDQIMGGLWITGRQWCDLVVYCDWLKPVGKDLFVKRIYRDEAAIQALEDDLVRFMRLVDANLEILRTPKKMSGAPVDSVNVPFTETLAVKAMPTTKVVSSITPMNLKSSRALTSTPSTKSSAMPALSALFAIAE